MPTFAYTARDMTGKQINGVLEANGEREVAMILSERSLFPVQVKDVGSSGGGSLIGRRKKVKGQTMAVFYSQMASLLRAGVPMIRSLTVLGEQTSDAVLKEVVSEIKGRVEDGEPIGDAMARFPRVFSEMGCNMVRAGTEGGFLEDALERVGTFTELQEDLKGRTISAMAYPVFLFSVGTGRPFGAAGLLCSQVRHAVRSTSQERPDADGDRMVAELQQLPAKLWLDRCWSRSGSGSYWFG